jgi:hypothetical protein
MKFLFLNNMNHVQNNQIYQHQFPLIYSIQSNLKKTIIIFLSKPLFILHKEMILLYLDLYTAKS